MEPFRRILVPLDFSDVSPAVLAMARRLLAPDGRAVVLHVVETLPLVTGGTFGVYAHRRDIEELKRLSQEKVAALCHETGDARLEPVVREGKPAHEIVDAAREQAAEVIVIGRQGRSRLDTLFVGSVTERVLRKASCHVLTVQT